MPLPELTAIDQYRLRRDLTWKELSAELRRARLPVAMRTLHWAVAHDAAHDRTLYKVREFLKRKRIPMKPTRRVS